MQTPDAGTVNFEAATKTIIEADERVLDLKKKIESAQAAHQHAVAAAEPLQQAVEAIGPRLVKARVRLEELLQSRKGTAVAILVGTSPNVGWQSLHEQISETDLEITICECGRFGAEQEFRQARESLHNAAGELERLKSLLNDVCQEIRRELVCELVIED
jgi:chromosome segregation ATPase